MVFCFKRYTIRSFEMGLSFRDGEFRGLLGAGSHWFFDPLGKVAVEVVSRRAPFLAHEKLDLIVKSGETSTPKGKEGLGSIAASLLDEGT